MARVEQAVFTSARTQRAAGYHLVAQSGGVCEADARELAVWCPSHDSLLDDSPEAVSINFHPLPSGRYCVSRTTPAGWEYSGRGGHRVYTQCLLVPPETLRRFGNNPFSLLRAAMASGLMQVHDDVPQTLEPIGLPGRASPVDQALLARLAVAPGPEAMASLVQAALDNVCLAVCGGEATGAAVIAGLFSCLPPEVRTEFSFTTGLKFSSRRPFRLLAVSNDPSEQRWVAHHGGVSLLDLGAAVRVHAPLEGWARLVGRVLALGRAAFLATQFGRHGNEVRLEELSALGLQWLEELEAEVCMRDEQRKRARAPVADDSCAALPGEPDAAGVPVTRGDAAHQPMAHAAMAALPEAPSKSLCTQMPGVVAKLERLDDLVFEAISGDPDAMQDLQMVWPTLRREVEGALLDESREQYLRYALQLWEGCISGPGLRDPAQAVQALDVLCLLFDED
ncbi:MAG: hypothetical protein ACOY3P_22740 [Planctomycetota bacterium]